MFIPHPFAPHWTFLKSFTLLFCLSVYFRCSRGHGRLQNVTQSEGSEGAGRGEEKCNETTALQTHKGTQLFPPTRGEKKKLTKINQEKFSCQEGC